MTAFVHSALQHAGEMSANARTAIRAEARMQAARALRASAELGAIVQSLIDAGINSVALKGPAFSEWLYNSSACRAFTDLDILVAPHEFAAAVRTLGALGYRLPPGISPAAARVVYACRGAWPLERPASFKIDLHWRTADRRFAEPFDAGAICRDATSFLVGGATVRIPSATHAAAVSFVHAAKHAWCGLEVLLSLAMLMRRTDVDWDRLMRAARRSGSVTAVVAGARLASELFDVPVPPVFRRAGTSDACVSAVVLSGYHALAMPTGTFPSRAAERDVHRRCLDRAGLRVRYDFLRVVMPTPAEAEVCRLPDPLTPLYAPLRIARVAALGIPAVLRSQSS
jgi:putative nucleotidyltransferase-like protein